MTMTDALLTPMDRAEAISRVYVRAVAARAGYVTAECDFDRDGVDLQIRAGGAMRPAVDLQLKATVNLGNSADGHCRFVLKRRNYDLLCEETLIPRLLVVLELPSDEDRWITITADELILRRRAYWLNLKGYEKTDNRSTVTVPIPVTNVFDVDSMRSLMEQSRRGSIR